MKKTEKIKIPLLLFVICLAVCWIFVLQYGIFGSDLDWVNQHSVLPDYFRLRFYDTGQLFPDIAWNLGAGQNIYNFSICFIVFSAFAFSLIIFLIMVCLIRLFGFLISFPLFP